LRKSLISKKNQIQSVKVGLRPRLPETNGENDVWERQKRQNGGTNPLELLNEINGIVGRILWIRLQKLAVLLAETGKLTTQKKQGTRGKALV
jgi:hypothetical protein